MIGNLYHAVTAHARLSFFFSVHLLINFAYPSLVYSFFLFRLLSLSLLVGLLN